MAVRLIADSTADLSPEDQRTWNVQVAPLGVTFGTQTYRDGVDITLAEFYQKLRAAKVLPTTTQVNPAGFEALYAPHVAAGDEVVVFCVSSGISGTYQSAVLAASQFPNARIAIIDTRMATLAVNVLVSVAARMRDQGASFEEIVAACEALVPRLQLYAIIDDLSYLVKGGRLHAIGGMVGGMLRLKPIVTVENGSVKLAALARGMKKAYQWIAQRAQEDGIDAAYPVCYGHTDAPELPAQLQAVVMPGEEAYETRSREVGVVMSTHGGPGAVAIGYIKKA